MNYEPSFTITSKILNLTILLCELLTKIDLNNKFTTIPKILRKNRIRTIRASLAIENNSLNLEQITAIINNKRILGNPREIQEVKMLIRLMKRSCNLMGLK
ncbi:hypothetical protein [Campylobacter sp. LR286c]|uniref:hypothetical protein n=1 Tax=Campylobacter sp. LR286c TaxID=2593545 RepID=UPI001237AA59|nr:hypothetical protein [Campylobacter sp. LR286c]KAA6228034.1 hypothetical protein FMM57_03285 [Campylobacter sp. LR286c]